MGWRGKAKHSLHADVKCATIRRGYAGVVELVDSMDLGSIANRRAGSSPAARTITATVIDTTVSVTVAAFYANFAENMAFS